MSERKRYAVPALEKGLDILEALASSPVSLSLTDLAAKLNRNGNELFRMCACLEERNYLTRDIASGKFMLTLRLYELAHTHSPVERLLKAALIPMQDFSDTTRESCHLGIPSLGRLLIVAQSESPMSIRLSIEVGARFDLLKTASGRLLMATMTEDERAVILAQSEVWRRWKPSERTAFLKRLEEVALAGVSTAENETIVGVRDLAVPAGSAALGVGAALACSNLILGREKGEQSLLLAALRKAAAEIGRRLGLSAAIPAGPRQKDDTHEK